jgi:DNA modification methylase
MIDLSDLPNKIYCANAIQILSQIPKNSIHLTITSPPYNELRDYDGSSFTKTVFQSIADQLYRTTVDGGIVVWVVGDQTINGSETGDSLRQALYFKDIGFNLHDTMIYLKTSFANPSNNRFHQVFEYMFVFSKGKPNTFHQIIDRETTSTHSGQASIRQKDGSLKKSGKPLQHDQYGGRFNVWKYKTGKHHSAEDEIAYGHPAIFPEQLARDHIYAWSNEDDFILDPMCGSGTVCKMAYLMKRNYIGIDISEKYCKIARKRIQKYKGRQKESSYWNRIFNKNKQYKSINSFF